jgi:hypothetical protein
MRTIVGRRTPNVTVLVREPGKPDRPLEHLPYFEGNFHSPDGFEWGYAGSGPADLAYAILREFFGDCDETIDLALKYHQRFKMLVVARLDKDEFELTETAIKEALAKIVEDEIRGVLS